MSSLSAFAGRWMIWWTVPVRSGSVVYYTLGYTTHLSSCDFVDYSGRKLDDWFRCRKVVISVLATGGSDSVVRTYLLSLALSLLLAQSFIRWMLCGSSKDGRDSTTSSLLSTFFPACSLSLGSHFERTALRQDRDWPVTRMNFQRLDVQTMVKEGETPPRGALGLQESVIQL